MPRPGLLATMREAGGGSAGVGYLAACQALNARLVQDGFDNALTGGALTKVGTVDADGTDVYGHAAVRTYASSYLSAYISPTVTFGSPFTFVGATDLTGSYNNDYSRLVAGVDSPEAFIGLGAARTSATTDRHTITADPGTWHWFAFTVSDPGTETSQLYRDGVAYGAPITRADGVSYVDQVSLGNAINNDAIRYIGTFSACAVFPSALTAQQVADLYAAYQRGL